MTDDHNPRAEFGDNRAPDKDPLLLSLEERYQALLMFLGDMELSVLDLPSEVKTKEDHDAVAAAVADRRKKAREAERARETEKADFLARGKVIDNFFKREIAAPILAQADALEQRLAPYLRMKREEEEARRRAEAEEARRRQEEERRKADAAAAVAREAERQAQEQAARVRQAESEAERRQEAERLRQQEQERQAAQKRADEAAAAASKAGREAERHERAADGGNALATTRGDGATTSLTKTWRHVIVDGEALMKSLGPLGAYLTNDQVSVSLAKCAREAKGTVAVPGVRFDEHDDVRTRGR